MKKILFFICILFFFTPKAFASLDLTKEYAHARVQAYSLSCEYSALSAILTKISGKNFSEDFLIEKSPKDWFGQSSIIKNKIRYWGNPEIGFVGKIHKARQSNYTGYGIYEKPLKTLVNNLGFSAETLNKKEYTTQTPQSHLTSLLNEIEKGNGVFMLADWCTDPKYEDGKISTKLTNAQLLSGLNQKNSCGHWSSPRKMYWKTLENGKEIDFVGLSGDHAFILVGYEGTKENPTHIRVFDTDTGFHKYPIHEWMRKWGKMDNRSLVIYKNHQNDLFDANFTKTSQPVTVEQPTMVESTSDLLNSNIPQNASQDFNIQANQEVSTVNNDLVKTLPVSIYTLEK